MSILKLLKYVKEQHFKILLIDLSYTFNVLFIKSRGVTEEKTKTERGEIKHVSDYTNLFYTTKNICFLIMI